MKLHNTLLLTGLLSLSLLATSGCGTKTPTAATGGGTTPITLTGLTTTFNQVAPALAPGAISATSGLLDMVALGTNLYVCNKNGTITKVDTLTGASSAIVPNPSTIVTPEGIATDGTNLYVADKGWHQIWAVNPATGADTLLAGAAGVATPGNVNANGTAARFNQPDGIAVTGGNLYICDSVNNTIRVYNIATTAVTTLTGVPVLSTPWDIVTDGTNLYVTEATQIRKIPIANPAGATILAVGSFVRADGIAIDPTGTYLFVSDTNVHKVFQVTIATNVVTLVAGSGVAGFANGTGAAATFNFPDGLAIVGAALYLADNSNNAIRKIQ